MNSTLLSKLQALVSKKEQAGLTEPTLPSTATSETPAEIDKFDLDTPLFKFSDEPDSASFTHRDSYNGISIFGQTGSGKTSGTARMLACRFLRAGYGACVLTVKQDEVKNWRQYCAETGRTSDLIILEPGGRHAFNFMEYESTHNDQISYVENLYQVLKTVIEAGQEDQGGKGGDDFFWKQALESYLLNVLSLCMLAYNKITVPLLYQIATAAPHSKPDGKQVPDNAKQAGPAFENAVRLARERIKKQTDALKKEIEPSLLASMTEQDLEFVYGEMLPDHRTFSMLYQYFMQDLYNIGAKTRSIINLSFSGFLNRLLREPLYSLFCRNTTFKPDECLQGKITLINLPVKVYQNVGQISQILYKYIWQRAMERRNINENGRGLFLFADEAQFFIHPKDAEFQSTARSSRVSTLYITQSINSYHAAMGGDRSEYKVKVFLDNLSTKIFHANTSIETNQFASDLIGSKYVENISRTTQMTADFNISNTTSYHLERMVRPEEFAQLKNGSPQNKHQVQAIVHMQGKKLKNGMSFQKISLNQKTNY